VAVAANNLSATLLSANAGIVTNPRANHSDFFNTQRLISTVTPNPHQSHAPKAGCDTSAAIKSVVKRAQAELCDI